MRSIYTYLMLFLCHLWLPFPLGSSLLCRHSYHAHHHRGPHHINTSRRHPISSSRSSVLVLPPRRRSSRPLDAFAVNNHDDDCNSNSNGDEYRKQYRKFQEQNLSSQIAGLLDDANFWSRPRNSHEIIEHVSRILDMDDDIDDMDMDMDGMDKAAQHEPKPRIQVISEDLPLLTIHNFISNDLCQEIIEAARKQGTLRRSTLGDDQSVSIQRTSSTTWLSSSTSTSSGQDGYGSGSGCDDALQILKKKASRLSDIPTANMENLQVVRYNGNGEKFDMHTDHQEAFNDLDCRGRLATCLVYLNSSNDGDALDGDDDRDIGDDASTTKDNFMGGETYFPEYAASVKPTRGTAVFWFNTVQRPGMEGYAPSMNLDVDLSSRHAGMPVFMNEKWVCNLWMHPVKQIT